MDSKESTPSLFERAQTLFLEALERPDGRRERFVAQACGADAMLCAEVLSLLEAHERADTFLALSSRAAASPSREHVGPYALIRELGRGGMGIVYLARRDDDQYEQEVALKLMQRSLAAGPHRPRFLAERQILARLQHPNIARLLDGGVAEDGTPYFAMEYVDGEPLLDYCDRRRLSIEARLRLFQSVCQAVHYAHQNLVVHRDLKPSNILVKEGRDGTPRVKLLDFGIAKLLEPDPVYAAVPVTQTGMRVMTPEYASPEQVRGDQITTASDVYALGVLLFELLTGRRPYQIPVRVQREVERIICEEAPERPSTALTRPVAPPASGDGQPAEPVTAETISQARSTQVERLRRRLAGDLDNIVLMALRKEPTRRYASAEQLMEDLRRHLDGMPVQARPDTWNYRAQKFVQRHRLGVFAAAGVAGLLLAFAVVMTIQADQVRQERDRAEAVKAFLIEMLEAVNPDEGANLTVRAVLDRSAYQVANDLFDQPELQVELYTVMSGSYQSLGAYMEAEEMAHQSLALRQSEYGMESVEAAAGMAALAGAVRAQARYAEAESLQVAALALRRTLLGPRHAEVAESLSGLAVTVKQAGDLDRAEALFAEALAMRRDLLGDGPAVARTLQSYGGLLGDLGRRDEAEEMLREAVAINRAHLPAGHSDLAHSINNHAITLKDLRRYDEAEPLYLEALEMRRQLYPDGHMRLAQSLNDIAIFYQRKGDLDAAEAFSREAVAMYQATLDGDHGNIARSTSNLAVILRRAGKLDEAELHYQEALAMQQRLYDGPHRDIANTTYSLARLYFEREDYAGAEPYYRDALAQYREVYGEDHAQVGKALSMLGMNQVRQGKRAEAIGHYQAALGVLRATLPAGDLDFVNTLMRLAVLNTMEGDWVLAAPYAREALGIAEAEMPADNASLADIRTFNGEILTRLGRYDEAEPLLLEGFATLEENKGLDDVLTRRTLTRLIGYYEAVGKTDEAARYRTARERE